MQYEIEIKSLLGSQQKADELLALATQRDPSTKLIDQQEQLNHYFKDGSLGDLIQHLANQLTEAQKQMLYDIQERAKHINVRSRQKNGEVLLIAKGSLDDISASHSHQRMEYEEPINLTLDELDKEIEASGWKPEAKWQASRRLYATMGLTMELIFTPGYGYVAEFEKIVHDESDRQSAHQHLINIMESLGAPELPNDRLERMFAYYNKHWQEYYGTDRIFTVK